MQYFQPTVRQLQPLGRRSSAPVVPAHVEAHARAADMVAPKAKTSAPRRRRRRHRLAARATLSS